MSEQERTQLPTVNGKWIYHPEGDEPFMGDGPVKAHVDGDWVCIHLVWHRLHQLPGWFEGPYPDMEPEYDEDEVPF